jgi:hypothetical protein
LKIIEPGDWQRTSPLAILFFFSQLIRAIVKNGWQGLAPLAALLLAYKGDLAEKVAIAGFGFAVVTSLIALLNYWFFRFQFTEDSIRIRHHRRLDPDSPRYPEETATRHQVRPCPGNQYDTEHRLPSTRARGYPIRHRWFVE